MFGRWGNRETLHRSRRYPFTRAGPWALRGAETIGRPPESTTSESAAQDVSSAADDDAALTADLARRCLDGDEAAWRAFVERFERPVFSLCFRMMRHRQDAEDAAQEALVRAIRSLGDWDRSRPILPWLLTIAANRCRTALGRRRRIPATTQLPVEPCSDAHRAGPETAEEIAQALDELRDEYRECFILFYQHELDCAEISDVLGCPVGTVKTWLHRARQQLAGALRRRGFVARLTITTPPANE